MSLDVFLANLMPKIDYLIHFLSKNIYNDVLCINASKVTALNIFQILIVISPLKRDLVGVLGKLKSRSRFYIYEIPVIIHTHY